MARKGSTSSSYAVPEASDVEFGILATLFTLPEETVGEITSVVRVDDFFVELHRDVFGAIMSLLERKVPVSRMTLREELPAAPAQFLADLSSHIGPFGRDLSAALRIVKRKSNARKLRAIYHEALIAVSADSEEPEMVASRIGAATADLSIATDRSSFPLIEVLDATRAEHERLKATGGSIGVLTGCFPKFDAYLKGFQRKVLTIFAGPTSHGKTAFMLDCAQGTVARNSETHAAIYSLEMSEMQISDRVRASHSRIELDRIRDWSLSDFDLGLIDEVHDRYRDVGRRMMFNAALHNIDEVVADARKLKSKQGLDIIFVDYLQLLEGEEDERSRERVVNQIAWKLFNLAKELDISVVGLSQVIPDAVRRAGQRLALDDLRDSKAIGHHARTVILISRPWAYDKLNSLSAPCDTLVQIEKNSEGLVGDLRVHFDGTTQKFREGDCDDSKCEWRNHVEAQRAPSFDLDFDDRRDPRAGGASRKRRIGKSTAQAEERFRSLGFGSSGE